MLANLLVLSHKFGIDEINVGINKVVRIFIGGRFLVAFQSKTGQVLQEKKCCLKNNVFY